MKWVGVAVLFASLGAWGQAAAEYGVVTSKTAAAAVATTDKLNQATSALTKKALNLDTPANATAKSGGAHKAQPPAAKRQAASPPASRSAALPAPSQQTGAPSPHPSAISVQGGAVRRSDPPGTKYPSAIQLGAPNAPPPK